MATFTKFNILTEHLMKGTHDLSTGSLTIALCSNASIPVVTACTLANLNTINVYTALTSRVIQGASVLQTTGSAKLVCNDLVLTASAAVPTFRHVVIYNDSATAPADALLGWYDYGSDVTMQNGDTFTIDFDNVNGIFSLS